MSTPQGAIRVLHVTTSSRIGGAERLIAALCKVTPVGEAELEVVTLSPSGPLTDELTAAGFTCHSLGVRHATDMPLALMRLRRLMADRAFDVVHGHLLHGAVAALSAGLMARVPVRVMTRHYSTPLLTYGSPMDRAIDRISNRLAQRIIAVGEAVRGVLIEQEGVDPDKVVVIFNGIDIRSVRAAAAPPASRAAVFTIGTVAALHPYKGHHQAFVALQKLIKAGESIRYELIGEGPGHAELSRLATRLGISASVEFLGFLTNPFPVVSSWDLYLQPSLEEGLSIAVLEAMGLGKPIICTSSGEMGRVIEDGSDGLLVPPGEPDAIAKAVHRLRVNQTLAARLGAGARTRVEREFDVRTTAQAHIDLYRALLSRRQV